MKTASSLVLDIDKALIDTSLLDQICELTNALKMGRKGSHLRKDNTTCEYFVIDTRSQFEQILTWQHERFNHMMVFSKQKEYDYLVIIMK